MGKIPLSKLSYGLLQILMRGYSFAGFFSIGTRQLSEKK